MKKFKLIIIALIILFVFVVSIFSCNKTDILSEQKTSAGNITLLSESGTPDEWTMFAHDPQATSASEGSITKLTEQWVYSPSLYANESFRFVYAGNMVADAYYVYFKHEVYNSTTGGTGDYSRIRKITHGGQLMYSSAIMGINHTIHSWPLKFDGWIFVNEDVVEKASSTDLVTPILGGGHGYDVFGSLMAADGKMFRTNIIQTEFKRPLGIFVTNSSFNSVWENLYPNDGSESTRGAIIYDNGRLFHSPNYYSNLNPLPGSGVIAYDANTGQQLWYKETRATGKMSAGYSKIFLFENSDLVARDQISGNILWSVPVSSICKGQPPVLVDQKVIIATADALICFDEFGNQLWSRSMPIREFDPNKEPMYTYIAAAKTSRTIVVTDSSGIRLLDYNGNQLDFKKPTVCADTLRCVNPIIVGNRLYVTVSHKTFFKDPNTTVIRLICLSDSNEPPPPPPDDTVPPPPPPPPVIKDTIPPVVNIISPQNNYQIPSKGNKNVYISFTATDNIGVVSRQILVDNSVIASNVTAYTWNANKATKGNHTITINAFDAAGNKGTQSITVYKN